MEEDETAEVRTAEDMPGLREEQQALPVGWGTLLVVHRVTEQSRLCSSRMATQRWQV